MDKALETAISRVSDLGLKILAALAVWIIGRLLIKVILNVVVARMQRRKVDPTLTGYARNTTGVALNIVLVVMIMGVVGIETTSFAAFIAGAGLAIGAAWGGMLSNFASGTFLVILRPFKVGDVISTAGVTGTVTEIGLFVTIVNTRDNVRTIIGNAKVLGGALSNFSANNARRVDLTGTLKSSEDVKKTIAEVEARLLAVRNVLAQPTPEVNILSFNESGCRLAIRPYTHNDNYWQVHFDATDALRGVLESVGPEHPAEIEKPEKPEEDKQESKSVSAAGD
jgi:small conductance mechanosensitive channel